MLKNIIIAATFLCICSFKTSENPIQEQKAKKRARFPEKLEDERQIRQYIPNRANEHIIWEIVPREQPQKKIEIRQPTSFFEPKARYNVNRIFRIRDKIIKSIESFDDELLQSVLLYVSRDMVCYNLLNSLDRKRYLTQEQFESKLYVFAPEDYEFTLYGFFNDPEIPKKMREAGEEVIGIYGTSQNLIEHEYIEIDQTNRDWAKKLAAKIPELDLCKEIIALDILIKVLASAKVKEKSKNTSNKENGGFRDERIVSEFKIIGFINV